MKHVITGNMKVWSVNSVAAVMMLCSGSALAAGFSQPQTQPFTLEFTQPAAPLTMSLTPVAASSSTLLAGSQVDGAKVADISISSTNAVRYGLRFTPGTFTPVALGAIWTGTVKEKSSASTVKLIIKTGAAGNELLSVGTDSYLVASTAMTSSSGFAVTYSGAQTVSPGVYPISVDVAAYTP